MPQTRTTDAFVAVAALAWSAWLSPPERGHRCPRRRARRCRTRGSSSAARTAGAIAACILGLLFASVPAGAGNAGSVSGSLWYESGSGSRLELTLVDGVVVPDELEGGERVKVLLVTDAIDQARFREALTETSSTLSAAIEAGLDRRVEFDVCRYDDGSEVEICGVHIHGDGISDTRSGFGAFGHFTQTVRFDDRVGGRLVTAEPEERMGASYSFDISFDLPLPEGDDENR